MELKNLKKNDKVKVKVQKNRAKYNRFCDGCLLKLVNIDGSLNPALYSFDILTKNVRCFRALIDNKCHFDEMICNVYGISFDILLSEYLKDLREKYGSK